MPDRLRQLLSVDSLVIHRWGPELRSAFLLLFFLPLGLAGCEATCKNACEKLFEECGLQYPDGYDSVECTSSCQYQQERLELIEGEDLLQGQIDCVMDTGCEDLFQGACYDDEVYIIPG